MLSRPEYWYTCRARSGRRLYTAAMRMPGTLCVIWLVSPWPMKPAPTMPTRIGLPSRSRAFSALSTIITVPSQPCPCCPTQVGAVPSATRLDAHFTLQFRLDLIQGQPAAVLGRHLADRKRPAQPEPAIVVQEAAFGRRRVELADLVAGLGLVGEHLVAMRKPLGHVERAVVVGGELDSDVIQIGRALRSQIDDDVENCTARAPHQLGLCRRRVLEMHAAERSLAGVEGDVALCDDGL